MRKWANEKQKSQRKLHTEVEFILFKYISYMHYKHIIR